MKTNSQIRQESLVSMRGNWGSAVVVTIVYLMIIFAGSFVAALLGEVVGAPVDSGVQELLNLLVSIFVVYPMSFSLAKLFLGFVRGEQQLYVGGVFSAFKAPCYGKSVGLYLLISIYTFLWALLLIVPGIIKSLAYSLAPYILADNPELTADQAINRSMAMMKGHKMDLFLMVLGYVGFGLLSLLALGIPLLWLHPYYQTVMAKFYEDIKSEQTAA